MRATQFQTSRTDARRSELALRADKNVVEIPRISNDPTGFALLESNEATIAIVKTT